MGPGEHQTFSEQVVWLLGAAVGWVTLFTLADPAIQDDKKKSLYLYIFSSAPTIPTVKGLVNVFDFFFGHPLSFVRNLLVTSALFFVAFMSLFHWGILPERYLYAALSTACFLAVTTYVCYKLVDPEMVSIALSQPGLNELLQFVMLWKVCLVFLASLLLAIFIEAVGFLFFDREFGAVLSDLGISSFPLLVSFFVNYACLAVTRYYLKRLAEAPRPLFILAKYFVYIVAIVMVIFVYTFIVAMYELNNSGGYRSIDMETVMRSLRFSSELTEQEMALKVYALSSVFTAALSTLWIWIIFVSNSALKLATRSFRVVSVASKIFKEGNVLTALGILTMPAFVLALILLGLLVA